MNKYKGKIIEAETKEDDIREICGMSFDKETGENKIENQSDNIIIWWCLCDYMSKYENVNGLLHHEKVKLKGVLKTVSGIEFKKLNSKEMRRKTLENYWIDGWEYVRKPELVIAVFEAKFDKENIEENHAKFLGVANDFINDIPKLISLISDGNISKIIEYVDNKFKE